jgi:hypothetical protein
LLLVVDRHLDVDILFTCAGRDGYSDVCHGSGGWRLLVIGYWDIELLSYWVIVHSP